jgi:hypothetical protein
MRRQWKILLLDMALLIAITLLCSCKRSSFYAPLGATVGGTVGALGGPAGAGGGALLGWSVGKGGALVEENKDLVQTVDALSQGDIQALVDQGMSRAAGKAEGLVDEIYSWTKILLIAVVAWNLVPLLYTRYVHKKAKENGKAIVDN